jgi:hypothetical protein
MQGVGGMQITNDSSSTVFGREASAVMPPEALTEHATVHLQEAHLTLAGAEDSTAIRKHTEELLSFESCHAAPLTGCISTPQAASQPHTSCFLQVCISDKGTGDEFLSVKAEQLKVYKWQETKSHGVLALAQTSYHDFDDPVARFAKGLTRLQTGTEEESPLLTNKSGRIEITCCSHDTAEMWHHGLEYDLKSLYQRAVAQVEPSLLGIESVEIDDVTEAEKTLYCPVEAQWVDHASGNKFTARFMPIATPDGPKKAGVAWLLDDHIAYVLSMVRLDIYHEDTWEEASRDSTVTTFALMDAGSRHSNASSRRGSMSDDAVFSVSGVVDVSFVHRHSRASKSGGQAVPNGKDNSRARRRRRRQAKIQRHQMHHLLLALGLDAGGIEMEAEDEDVMSAAGSEWPGRDADDPTTVSRRGRPAIRTHVQPSARSRSARSATSAGSHGASVDPSDPAFLAADGIQVDCPETTTCDTTSSSDDGHTDMELGLHKSLF